MKKGKEEKNENGLVFRVKGSFGQVDVELCLHLMREVMLCLKASFQVHTVFYAALPWLFFTLPSETSPAEMHLCSFISFI